MIFRQSIAELLLDLQLGLKPHETSLPSLFPLHRICHEQLKYSAKFKNKKN